MFGRALLLTVLAMFVISMIITKDITRSTNMQNDNLVKYRQRVAGRNYAESGINLGLRKLAVTGLWRSPLTYTMDGSTINVGFADTVFMSKSAVKITSTATVPYTSATQDLSDRDTSFTAVVFVEKPSLPPYLRGAITANNAVWTSNLLVVDGRDHSSASPYAVLSAQGGFGIWTTGSFLQLGSSAVGGTNSARVDFSPAVAPIDSGIYRQNQAGEYPGTPDSILGGDSRGYPEGTLKQIAQSGVNGSQYATDPTLLTRPYSGVTYVEIPSGTVWQPTDLTGSGILVVHNSARNALIRYLNSGTFVGMIIADDIHNINTTIVGSVVSLTTAPYTGHSVGWGTGSILFSNSAISNALVQRTYTNRVLAWWE